MKKDLFRLLSLALVITLFAGLFCFGAAAAGEDDDSDTYEYIFQDAAFLSQKERDSLESKSDRLYSKYKYTVACILVEDYADYRCSSIEEFSVTMVKELELGKKVVLLSVSMDDRSYDIYVTDGASEAFHSDAVGYYIEDAIVSCLKADDWYGACQTLQAKSEDFLQAWKAGTPMAKPRVTPGKVAAVVGISLLSALIVCSILKAQMKSAKIQTNADNYLVSDSFNLTVNLDQYTHTTETRHKIEKQSSSGSRGGGGGSHHSGHF